MNRPEKLKQTPPVTTAKPLASLNNAGIFRDGHWLMRHVGMAIRPGEIVTVIGPNGSGKTTAAKTLLGLMAPDEGSVERQAKLRIGYVPQKLAVDWTLPLTVRRLMTLTARHDRRAVDAALAETGADNLADARVQTLSGGEFQRVLLARALIGKPQLLVLDEPVQGVDFTGEIALYDLIRTLRDRLGCGVLMISHDLHIVMAQTDTVICLNGHVCCHGTPETVAESAEYRQLFGPRAAQSLAVYRHDHDHVHGADGEVIPHGHHHHHDHGTKGDGHA